MRCGLSTGGDGPVRLIVLAACFAAFMNILDISIMNVSLPSVVRDLRVGTSVGACFQMAYSVMLAGTVLEFGKLADRIGIRRVMAWGFPLFMASSLFCGLAPSAPVLMAGRVLQGVAGGMLSATSLGAVGRFLPPERRGGGVGMVSAASALGAMLGGPIGGFLSETMGWRWIFFVNVPFALAAWIIVTFRIPKESDGSCVRARGLTGIDPAGVLLSLTAVISLLYGIGQGPTHGWLSPPVVGAISCSAAFCALFCIRERRIPNPTLSLGLFRNPRFVTANAANFFTSMFIAGVSFLFPFYFILREGLSQSAAGVAMLFLSGVYVFVSPTAGKLSDRIGARLLTTGGMTLASGSLFLFAALSPRLHMEGAVALLAILGVAYGAYLSPNNRLILSLAPPNAQGSASGVLRVLFYIGQPLGVAMAEAALRGSLPEGDLLVSHWSVLPPVEITSAFHVGFIVCAIMAMLAAMCSLITGRSSTLTVRSVSE